MKVHYGTVLKGRICRHVKYASSKTVPQCTLTTSRPGITRNLKVANIGQLFVSAPKAIRLHSLGNNLICCKTGLNLCGKPSTITIQLVLQQCCKTRCTSLLPVKRYLKAKINQIKICDFSVFSQDSEEIKSVYSSFFYILG